jgi:hypothetical protein
MKMSAWHGQNREVNPKKAQLGRKIAHRCILMGCFVGYFLSSCASSLDGVSHAQVLLF